MQRPVFRKRAFGAQRLLALTAVLTLFGIVIEPATAQSGAVVKEKSRIYVFVAKKNAGHDHGIEGNVADGEIHLDRAQNTGRLSFDLRSLSADGAAARTFFNMPGEVDADTQAAVNANMHGAAVLNIAQFPTAEFVITQLQVLPADPAQAGRPYQLDGEFTLHGVKRPLQIVATAESVAGLIRLRGRFAMKQTDFGIKPYSKLLGAVGIADELQVYGDIWLNP